MTRIREQEQREAFASRLTALRVAKGWSQSELARRAKLHAHGRSFGRDNISKYESATTMPLPLFQAALAKALGVSPSELIPESTSIWDVPGEVADELEFKKVGQDRARVRFNREMPIELAFRIMGMLQSLDSDHTRNPLTPGN